jgi:hypothetical protein
VSNDKPTAAKPTRYWRALAEANEKIGWPLIPDCPWEFFEQMMAAREREHPEAAVYTVEYRARILNEAIYGSKKIASVEPPEWRAEFPWLLALSNTDGTFEADAHSVWAKAYAFARPDFTSEKVGRLLDEYARVGLLLRKEDADGRLWGFWVGSDNFQPPPSKRAHYKQGKRALFSASATPEQRQDSASAAPVQPLCTPAVDKVNTKGTIVQPEFDLDFGVGVDLESDSDSDLVVATKSSENEQPQEQTQKQVREENLSPEPTPTPKTQRLRKVLPRAEFESMREDKEYAAALVPTDAEKALLEELKATPRPVFTEEELKRLGVKKR